MQTLERGSFGDFERLELKTFDKFEIIQLGQKPSETHALTYIIPKGDHSPELFEEIREMIGKMLGNAIQQVPAGYNNYECKNNQPSSYFSSLKMTHAELDRCSSMNLNPVRYSPGAGVVCWGASTRFLELESFGPAVSAFYHELMPSSISEMLVVFNILRLNEILKSGIVIDKQTQDSFYGTAEDLCQRLMDVRLLKDAQVYPASSPDFDRPFAVSVLIQMHRHGTVKIDVGTEESVRLLAKLKSLFIVDEKWKAFK